MKQGTRKILVSFLLILAMLSGMIPGAAMAEELVFEEALPEQTEAVPAEELFIEEETPAEEILIEDDTVFDVLPVVPDDDESLPTGDGSDRVQGNAQLFMDPADQPVETDISKLDGTNWMAGIRGDRYLNEFNIPYTHDCAMQDYIDHPISSPGATFGGGSFSKTQYYQIDGQLERGVRILDLRLNNYYEVDSLGAHGWLGYDDADDDWNLYLCHGKKPTSAGVYWAANKDGDFLTLHQVFWMVRDFLRDHPTETVILDFSIEVPDKRISDDGPVIAERLKKIITQVLTLENPSTGKPYIYTEPGLSSWDTAYTHMPQLKDCRGQAVLLCQSQYFSGVIGGMKRSIVPDNDILGGSNTCNADHKVEHLEEDMAKFNVRLPGVGEHLGMLRIIDTNSHAQQGDDFIETYLHLDNMRPLAIAEDVHPKMFGDGKLLSEPGRFYGWVKMDGATRDDCRYIYMTNFTTTSSGGTGAVTLTVDPGDVNDPTNAAYYALYDQQSYVLPENTYVPIPGDIYDVRSYNRMPVYTAYFDHWEATDEHGNTQIVESGKPFCVYRDLTFKAIYNPNHGKYREIVVKWDDGENIDNLRPNKLNLVCTYTDANNKEAQKTLTVDPWSWGYYDIAWVTNFTGDLKSIRPDWARVPTWPGNEEGVNGKDTYSFDVSGDLTNDPYVTVTLHHTVIPTKYGTVSGTISWIDRYDRALRPESVSLQLYADQEPVGDAFIVKAPAAAEEADTTDGVVKDYWTWEIPNLPINNYDKRISYSVVPVSPSNYRTYISGTNIRFVHDAETVSRDVRVEWVDNNNESRMRPSYIELILRAMDNGEEIKSTGAAMTDWSEKKTLNLFGTFQSWYNYELRVMSIKGYDTDIEWVEGSGDDSGYFLVTNTLIDYKPTELDGVFKAGYEPNGIRGDWIDCGLNGAWLDTGDSEPTFCRGVGELRYAGYEEGNHEFTFDVWTIKIADDDSTRPWGIAVSGGSGTEENPYTFRVLRREAVPYWEAIYDDEAEYVAYAKHYTTDYELLTDDTDLLEPGMWYVVNDNVQLLNRLIVTPGDPVHLILRHGKSLYADSGIGVGKGATLNIHTEWEYEDGRTAIVAREYNQTNGAAIGGTANGNEDFGTIIVHNGTVDAGKENSDSAYPAIGGLSVGAAPGDLIVYGGTVKAHTEGAIAIGDDVTVDVYGGSVLAKTDSTDVPAIAGMILTGPGIGVYNGLFESEEPSAENEAVYENGDLVRTSEMSVREGHIHKFVYKKMNNKIMAICKSSGCPVVDPRFVLSIQAPKLSTYDPNATEDDVKATLGDWAEFIRVTHTHISPDSIRYYKMLGNVYQSITEPSNEAGDYMAQVVLPGVTTVWNNIGSESEERVIEPVSATVYYTIKKAKVELTNSQPVRLTYGSSLNESNVKNYVTVSPDTPGVLSWEDGSIIPPVGTTEEFTLFFTPEDLENYEIATCKVRLDVRSVAPTVTPPKAVSSLQCTGQPQELITRGSATGGIMMYALGARPRTYDGWQYAIPTATEPGTYRVWYKVFGDESYSDTTGYDYVTVTIDPGITGVSLVLDGSLDMRFYVAVPTDFDSTGAHMTFTVPDADGRVIDISYADAEIDANGEKIFSCPVYSIEMAKEIQAEFFYGEGSKAEASCSVKRYLDSITGGDAYDLAVATKNYGHYMQLYLAGLHGFNLETDYPAIDAGSEITAPIAASELFDYARVVNTRAGSVEAVSYFLTLGETTKLSLRLRFTSAPGSVSAVVTANNDTETVASTVKALSDTTYLIEIPNIAANNLGAAYHVTVTADDDTAYDISLSALSYVYTMLNANRGNADEDLAFTALYNYYAAADAYRKAH